MSARLKLTLSYAGFLVAAGAVTLLGVFTYLRYTTGGRLIWSTIRTRGSAMPPLDITSWWSRFRSRSSCWRLWR